MTGWGNDDARNPDWQDYAAALRGEAVEKREPRWWRIADVALYLVLVPIGVYLVVVIVPQVIALARTRGDLP